MIGSGIGEISSQLFFSSSFLGGGGGWGGGDLGGGRGGVISFSTASTTKGSKLGVAGRLCIFCSIAGFTTTLPSLVCSRRVTDRGVNGSGVLGGGGGGGTFMGVASRVDRLRWPYNDAAPILVGGSAGMFMLSGGGGGGGGGGQVGMMAAEGGGCERSGRGCKRLSFAAAGKRGGGMS